MAICIRNDTTPAIEIEYLSGCSQKSKLPNFTLAPEPQTGYPLYPDADGISNGWHIILPKEAHNLVKNPTFFNGLEEWTEANSLLTRSNVNSFDSGFSALIRGSGDVITADRRAYIETEAEGFEPGQSYVFSAYLWMPELLDSQDPIIGTISIVDDNGTTTEEVFSRPLERFGKWVRVAVSKTIRTDATSVLLRVNLRSQDQQELTPPYNPTGDFNLATEYMFADMLQFEDGITPTTPFHGSTQTCNEDDTCCCDAYKWLGAAHRSISYRSDCTRDGGELVSLSSMGFEILEHTGHGAPPVRDIYYDYTNRPGGKYQKTVIDTNVLTLAGFICEKSLKELECEIFGLQGAVFPSLSKCDNQMLLVYVHETCDNIDCDPERYLAYCVSYIGGLEGVRNNLFQQRLALQFRAYNPFPFEWPGHTSHPLDFDTITTGRSVAKIGLDEVRGYAIDENNYRTITCVGVSDGFLIGGEFEGVNSTDESINVAVHNCEEFCEHELIGGAVNVSIKDGSGNIIVGGAFVAPYAWLAIYYSTTDIWAGFDYSGGEVLSLAAPFWAEVVAGAVSSVSIVTATETFVYTTDGPVNALVVMPDGTLYAFGDFTTIDGIAATNAAKLDVNSEGCLDIENAAWESLGFSLDGAVITADTDGDSIYIGGAFTQATPDAVATCSVINGTKVESKGGSQIVRFSDDTPAVGQITIQFEVTNIVARATVRDVCLGTADPERMLRMTAKSTEGTVYSFIFPEAAFVSTTMFGQAGALYIAQVVVDKSYVLSSGSCPTDNQALVDDIAQSISDAELYASLNYQAGLGVDDNLNSVVFQCVQRVDSYQGDSTPLNHVGAINGDNIGALGDGIDATVNVLHVEECSGELLAGTSEGLMVWTGREWTEYQGLFGNPCDGEAVIDIDSCGGDLYVLYDGSNRSLLPGVNNISYLGGIDTFDFELIIHGAGKVKSFANCDKVMRFCTELQCGEIARLNFNNGSFKAGARNLGSSILGGSRYDMILSKCENPLKLLITDTQAGTKATLLYRRQYVGIEALCCSPAGRAAGAIAAAITLDFDACCLKYEIAARDPTVDDCAAEGYKVGDIWLNAAGVCSNGGSPCARLFVNADNECCDEDAGALNLIDGDGNILLDAEDGNAFCPPDP